MGCGCGKRGVVPRRAHVRPTVGPRPIVGGSAAGASPVQIRALGLQAATPATSAGETRRMDEQRRRIEKIRRDVIARKLNK